jgi:TolB-like protein/DNA-binding winged helix-turn-helix (wHTH) protein/Tfp pilus assembly protein PilF
MASPSLQPKLQFGPYELDLKSGELRKRGIKIHIQDKPLTLLIALISHSGEVVSRAELQRLLWPDQTFVDFEDGINTAARKLREALGDDAEKPRYVETVPRRGYRFIVQAESVETRPQSVGRSALPERSPASSASLSSETPIAGRRHRRWLLPVAVLLVVAALSAGLYRRAHDRQLPARIIIVVLPVQNLSGDPSREFLSDGLTEEIITQLSRYNPTRLGVIARTSSMVYKSRIRNVGEIGRELGVDYVVESSLRSSGDKLRVTSQLVRVSDQTHLWSATYDRTLQDLFGVQDEIAQAIALHIRVELANASSGHLASTASVSPDAHLAYLEGRYFWNKRSPAALRTAIEHFKRAIQLDGNYAQAYTGLADAYSSLCLIADVRPIEYFPLAKAAAARAIQLDDDLAEAHSSLAYVKMWFEWDWAGAESEFLRAIDLNPGYATAHQWYAEYLRLMGRQQEAINESKLALELDPLSLIINMELGLPFYYEGKYDEAVRQFKKAVAMDPSFALAHCELGWVYEDQGRMPEAIQELLQAAQGDDASPVLASLGHAYALAGRKDDALRILDRLQQRAQLDYVGPNFFAFIYSALGNEEKGLDALDQAYADRHWGLVWMNVRTRFESLKPQPRYQAILKKMKFPH